MDRKSIILGILCIALAIAWPWIMRQLYPPPPPAPVAERAAPTSRPEQVTMAEAPAPEKPLEQPIEAEKPKAPVAKSPDKPRPPEQIEVVETDLIRVHFTSYGGGIQSVELKKYPTLQDEAHLVVLNDKGEIAAGTVTGIDGFDAETAYELQRQGMTVTFEAVNERGIRITKEFHVGEGYLIDGSISVANKGLDSLDQSRLWLTLGTSAAVLPNDRFELCYFDWSNGKDIESVNSSAFNASWWSRRPAREVIRYDDVSIVWAGVENRFFCMLWMPEVNRGSVETTRKIVQRPGQPIPQKPGLSAYAISGRMASPPISLKPEESYHYAFRLYAGPKEYHRLKDLGKGQVEVMHWGWFEWMAELLLKSMNGLHNLVPNYFWIIIIITIIIKLAFWPLTAMSNRSMKAMQALAPKMTALREKYKDDPQKLNAEMMKMYREHKVNPMAGCLPTVVQIPVFIGFFYMLRSAIELRGHGALWIQDLSQPDTIATIGGFALNPLPVFMGATMIFQMRMTPSTMDPAQQKIMMFMPLLFLFFCYGMPSGLVLYWTVQNIFTMIQMALTKHAPAATGAGAATSAVPRTTPSKTKVKKK